MSKLTSYLAVQVVSSVLVDSSRMYLSTVVVSRAIAAPWAIICATARLPAERCRARTWPYCVSGTDAGAATALSATASVSSTCSFTPGPRRAARPR